MVKINQEAYFIAFKLLLAGETTITSLQNATGLHRVTLLEFTKCLRKHKIIYICDWEPDSLGRDAFAVFKLGAKKDVPRYKTSGKERTRKYREKKKLAAMRFNIPTSTLNAHLPA